VQAPHVAKPAIAVALPGAHGAQARSELPVAAVFWYVPAGHTGVNSVHSRSLVSVGARDSNCSAAHWVLVLHMRSEVEVGGAASYSMARHTVCFAHTRSEEAVGAARSHSLFKLQA
jgi:hypothetical protein